VHLGVNVPNFGPGTDPDMLLRWARTVEGLGFDLLMVSDHVVVTPDVAEQYPTAAGTTMYTSCQPCGMCTGAIQRPGLGRVVFALSNEQLGGLKPPGTDWPYVPHVPHDGPALYEEARVPVDGYYT
jgi:hypothetical protein